MNERYFDLHSIFSIVRRRLKLIFAIVVVGMLLASTLLVVLPPSYVAKTQLLLDVAGSSALNSAQSNAFGLTNSIVESEAKLIKSEPVLRKVFAELDLAGSAEFSSERSWLGALGILGDQVDGQNSDAIATQTLEEFSKHISAKRVGLTFLIEVVARSENAKRAADIANTIANSHIELKLHNSFSQTRAAQTLLENSVVQNRVALEVADARLQSFFLSTIWTRLPAKPLTFSLMKFDKLSLRFAKIGGKTRSFLNCSMHLKANRTGKPSSLISLIRV